MRMLVPCAACRPGKMSRKSGRGGGVGVCSVMPHLSLQTLYYILFQLLKFVILPFFHCIFRKKRKSTRSAPRGPPRMLSDFKTNTLSEEHDPEIQSVRGTFPSHSNQAFNSDELDSDNNDPPPAYGDEDDVSLNGFGKPRIYDNNKFSNNYTSYGPSASNRSYASSDEENDVKGNDMLY